MGQAALRSEVDRMLTKQNNILGFVSKLRAMVREASRSVLDGQLTSAMVGELNAIEGELAG